MTVQDFADRMDGWIYLRVQKYSDEMDSYVTVFDSRDEQPNGDIPYDIADLEVTMIHFDNMCNTFVLDCDE